MRAEYIYHICEQATWEIAVADGVYRGGDLDRRDGFIHFSEPAQVAKTAERYLSGVTGLVLLKVEAKRLGNALKWEESRDNLLFPHLYSSLDPKDVQSVFELHLDADGRHIFPEMG